MVDGASGSLTITAIKKLQNIVGIIADGLCNALEIIMKKPVCSITGTADIHVKMSHMMDINSNTWLLLFSLSFLVVSEQ